MLCKLNRFFNNNNCGFLSRVLQSDILRSENDAHIARSGELAISTAASGHVQQKKNDDIIAEEVICRFPVLFTACRLFSNCVHKL